jgi:hypothetical protein
MNTSRLASRFSRLIAAGSLLALGGGIHDAAAGGLRAVSEPSPIVGGERNYGDPAVAFLVVYGAGGEQSICTGSLVASRWILTAAHCVSGGNLGFEPAAIEIYFGTEYTTNDPGFVFSTEADGYAYHDGYDPQVFGNHDIAMLHLVHDVPLTPMSLNARPLSNSDLGTQLRLIGWGLTNGSANDPGIKRHASSAVFDYDDLLVQVGGSVSNICSGDSGGPSVMSVGGAEVIVGVTSFGDVDCAELGVSVRVDAYLDWIAAVTEGEVVADSPPAAGGCQSDADCSGGVCVYDGESSTCTDVCSSADDCSPGWDCLETDQPNLSVCWPSDGGQDPGDPPPPSDGPAEIPGDDDDDDDTNTGDRHFDGSDDAGAGCTIGDQTPPPLALALLALVMVRRRTRVSVHASQ